MSTKKVGIWLRVSTEDQAKGDSPEHHEKRGRMYAEVKNWDVVEVYHLEGVSGKKVLDHPEAQRMLKDVIHKRISGLIFSKLARLARNTRELLDISDFFREHDADLISLEEAIDTSSPAGRLFYTVISAVAQWEREEIASRVKASVPIRAKMGKRIGGQTPLGYNWVDNELQINEDEAPIRRLIFELYVKEQRKKTVAAELNKRGYRTKRNKEFTAQAVTKILRDPVAKGLRRANYSTIDKTGKKVDKPESEWIFVKAPAIVSEELWDECNRILDSKMIRKPARKVTYLFSSHLHCHCDGKMYVTTSNPKKYTCRKCQNKIVREDIEVIFHEQLKSFLFSEEDIEKYMSEAKRTVANKMKEMEALKKKEAILRTELNNVIRLNTKGVLSDNDFPEHYEPVSVQLKQVRVHISELQGELDALNTYVRDNDFMLNEAKDLYSRWDGLSFESKRSIIELIVQNIIVGKEDIEINLLYSPTSIPTHHPLLKGGEKGNQPFPYQWKGM